MMINRVYIYIYTYVWPTGIDEEWIHIYIYTLLENCGKTKDKKRTMTGDGLHTIRRNYENCGMVTMACGESHC
jgi:hypothetical protein